MIFTERRRILGRCDHLWPTRAGVIADATIEQSDKLPFRDAIRAHLQVLVLNILQRPRVTLTERRLFCLVARCAHIPQPCECRKTLCI